MSLDYEEIGHNIRISGLRKHFKQSDWGELINVSSQYISHIECGKNKVSLDVLVRLSKALSVNLYTLLGENDKAQMNSDLSKEVDTILANLSLAQQTLCLELCRTVANIMQQEWMVWQV